MEGPPQMVTERDGESWWVWGTLGSVHGWNVSFKFVLGTHTEWMLWPKMYSWAEWHGSRVSLLIPVRTQHSQGNPSCWHLGLGAKQTGLCIWTQPLASCMILDKLLDHSEPRFPYLENGILYPPLDSSEIEASGGLNSHLSSAFVRITGSRVIHWSLLHSELLRRAPGDNTPSSLVLLPNSCLVFHQNESPFSLRVGNCHHFKFLISTSCMGMFTVCSNCFLFLNSCNEFNFQIEREIIDVDFISYSTKRMGVGRNHVLKHLFLFFNLL